MKESYGEGLATHADPESCGRHRKVAFEALTGDHAGPVLSSEIEYPRGQTLSKLWECNISLLVMARTEGPRPEGNFSRPSSVSERLGVVDPVHAW